MKKKDISRIYLTKNEKTAKTVNAAYGHNAEWFYFAVASLCQSALGP